MHRDAESPPALPERPYIRAERLEEPIWSEVKRVIQNPEQRKEILQMVVEEVIVDRKDNVDITLAIPIESEPTTEDSVYVQTLAYVQTLESFSPGLCCTPALFG